jgi:hypothetical protein
VPHLGTALSWLADPDTRQLVIGIPAAMIAFGALLELLGVAPLGEQLRRLRRRQAGGELVQEGAGGGV